MKKVILIVLVFISLQAVAQRSQNLNRGEMMQNRMSFINDLSENEIADLQTKRMTFYLDLSDSQKSKVHKINLDIAKTRKSFMETFQNKKGKGKPSSQELYKTMNKRLDKQIEVKKQLKEILSKKQLEKWSEMQMKHPAMGRMGKPNFAGRN